jgi:hypothetical protein
MTTGGGQARRVPSNFMSLEEAFEAADRARANMMDIPDRMMANLDTFIRATVSALRDLDTWVDEVLKNGFEGKLRRTMMSIGGFTPELAQVQAAEVIDALRQMQEHVRQAIAALDSMGRKAEAASTEATQAAKWIAVFARRLETHVAEPVREALIERQSGADELKVNR